MCTHRCLRVVWSMALAVSLTYATSASDVTNEMHIKEFTAEPSTIPVNGTITIRCSIANMDPSRFVRYLKVDRKSRNVILTTNSVKEDDIKTLDRYSIEKPKENNWNGYDFILTIAEAQVEDSGTYVCSIPQLDSSAHVEVSVINDPTSIELHIDNRLVAYQAEHFKFDDVTEHNVTCTASGGYPQPVLNLSLGRVALDSTTLSKCRVQESTLHNSFLAHVTCSSTASVSGLVIDYATSGSSLTCSAISPSSSSVPLTVGAVVELPGGLPKITCENPVVAKVHSKNVRVQCQVHSFPPLTDAYIQWSDNGLLRPAERQNEDKFVRDGHMTAFLRSQGGNMSLLEMVMTQVHPQMFRNYHFVAVNGFGADGYFVTLEREAEVQAVQSNKKVQAVQSNKERSKGTHCYRSDNVLLLFTSVFMLPSFVISRRL